MKQIHFLRNAVLTLTIAASPAVIHAQDFLNGSFEQNGSLCLINASTAVFNANVKYTRNFEQNRKPDIAGNNCGFGSAKEGSWFVGLASNIQGGVPSEAITLQLGDDVRQGAQYTLTFWSRARSYASNLELGVSSSDSSAGKIFYTVSASTIGQDWTEISIRFTAPQNGSFISVRAVNPNINSGVWLDGFHLSPVFQPDNVVAGTKPMEKTTAVRKTDNVLGLYPNPSEGFFKVSADSSQVVSLTVYNMVGSQVESHVATAEQPIPDHIDLTDQQPGMYFVEVGTVNGEKLTKRIIVSR